MSYFLHFDTKSTSPGHCICPHGAMTMQLCPLDGFRVLNGLMVWKMMCWCSRNIPNILNVQVMCRTFFSWPLYPNVGVWPTVKCFWDAEHKCSAVSEKSCFVTSLGILNVWNGHEVCALQFLWRINSPPNTSLDMQMPFCQKHSLLHQYRPGLPPPSSKGHCEHDSALWPPQSTVQG